MNSFLMCLFVFTFGTMASKTSVDMEKNVAPGINTESLQTGSFNPLSASHDASLIRKRTTHSTCTGRWQKANSSPVCFGAKYSQFGTFFTPSRGKLAAVKLVHLYGYVSCDTRSVYYWSFWGCGERSNQRPYVGVVITTSGNHILLPPSRFHRRAGKWSKVPGYNSFSPEIILPFFSHPYWVYKGKRLRLWYGEDLVNYYEGDNGGKVCCDVYTLFV